MAALPTKCLECDVKLVKANKAIRSSAGGYRSVCRPCYNKKMRAYFRRYKQNNINFIANTMLRDAKKRAKGRELPYSLDKNWLLKKLQKGVCEMTQLRFEASVIRDNNNGMGSGFFAPSLDRINSKLGYTKRNTRIVIWGYNRAKGEHTDNEVKMLAYAVLKGRL